MSFGLVYATTVNTEPPERYIHIYNYNITFSFAFSINLTTSSKSVKECTSSHKTIVVVYETCYLLPLSLPSISLDISSNSSASDKGLILIDVCSKTIIHEIFNLRRHRYSIVSFY